MNNQLLRKVWRLAVPVLLTNLLQSLVGVIDTFMVGRLGPIAIAAVGMSNVIRLLVLVLVLSVAAGAMSLVAQAKGARNENHMSYVTRQSISSGVLLSLILTVLGLLLARPLLLFANGSGEPEAVALGTRYLRILFLGTPFLVLNIVFNRLMQGAGDSWTPLVLTAGLNALNVGFNYAFMFGFGPIPAMGVAGAAVGTVLSRALGVAIVLYLFYGHKNVIKILPGTYRPDWRMFGDILSIGVPSGIQGVFRNGSRLLVIGILTSTEVGTYGAAALAIGVQIESLAFMPVLGINVAGTSLVGQALGSWQTEEAKQRGNMTIILGIALMIVLITPMIIFAPQIIRLFDPSAHPILAEAGTTYLRLTTFFLPFSAIAMVANGNLRGAGDSLPGMISTMLNRTAITIGLAYLMAFTFEMGSRGVWIALAIGMVLDGLMMGVRWRNSHAWLKVALRKTQLYRQHLRYLSADIQQQYLHEIRTPLMAKPGATEDVTSAGVIYHLQDRDVSIQFDNGRFQLV